MLITDSLAIEIVGDLSKLPGDLASATAYAQSAGAKMSAAFNTAAASSDRVEAAIHRLNETVKQSISAQNQWLTQGAQQSKALASGLGGVAASGHAAGLGLNHVFRGIKDIAEGRGTFALAQLANTLVQMGPTALAVGGGLALIGGAAYGISKLNEYTRGLPEAAAAARAPFAALNDELEIGNEKLQVASDKIQDELNKLAGKPPNGLKDALDETIAATAELTVGLKKNQDALYEILKKKEIGGLGGFLKNEASTTGIKESVGGVTGQGGLTAQLADIQQRDAVAIRLATTELQRHDAELKLAKDLTDAYGIAILNLNDQLRTLKATNTGPGSGLDNILSILGGRTRVGIGANNTEAIAQIQQTIRNYQAESKNINLSIGKDDSAAKAEQQQKAQEFARQAGATAAAQTSAELADLTRRVEARRAATTLFVDLGKQRADAEAKALADEGSREVAEATAAVAAARAKESAITGALAADTAKRIALIRQEGTEKERGQVGPERQRIGIETGESVRKAQDDADKERLRAHGDVLKAMAGQQAALSSAQRSAIAKFGKEVEAEAKDEIEQQKGITAATEIEERGTGQRKELEIEGQKLAVEGQYARLAVKTAQDRIRLAQQELTLDTAARAAKLAGLQAELSTASAAVKDADTTEQVNTAKSKEAEIRVQIADLAQQNTNSNIKEATAVDVLNRELTQTLTLQQQITSASEAAQQTALKNQRDIGKSIGTAIGNLPKDIGNDIGGSIASALVRHHPGQSIGKEMGETLRSTGAALAKTIISGAVQLGLQAFGHVLVGLIPALGGLLGGGVQAASTTANTVATTANTVATSVETGIAVANTASIAALTVAVVANTVALYLNTFVPKPFGFAGGGPPPVGVPSIVGERGPEMFIPHESGTIIPNHMLKGYADGAGLSAIGGSTNIGEMHFHAHGMTDSRAFIRHVARELPGYLKSTGPQFSPLSR
jgi:hypothetical protein